MMSSARVCEKVSSQEEDLLNQSTKKVKRKAADAEPPLLENDEGKKQSYRETLLKSQGNEGGKDTDMFWKNDEAIPGLNWYGVPDEKDTPQLPQEVMARYINIPIEEEEFKEWCKPWGGSLMVSAMGR